MQLAVPAIVALVADLGHLRRKRAADKPRTVTSWPRGGSLAMANRVNNPYGPLPTVTCANRGELTLISLVLLGAGGPVYAGNPVAAD